MKHPRAFQSSGFHHIQVYREDLLEELGTQETTRNGILQVKYYGERQFKADRLMRIHMTSPSQQRHLEFLTFIGFSGLSR